MTFRTQYSDSMRIHSNSGNRFVPNYDSSIDENGVLVLKEVGKYDLYDEIQSYKESCDIKSILARFALGETDVLEKYQGAYLDTTKFPTTYAEFQQQLIDANNMFDSLPAEIKRKFENDPNQFFAKFGSDEWSDKLGIKPVEKPVDKPTIPVEKPTEVVPEVVSS